MHLKLATSWEGVSGRKKRAVLVAQLGLSGPRLGLVLLRDAIAPLEMAQVGGLSERLLKVACQGHLCQKNSSIPNGNKNRQFIPFGMEECLELDELTETQLSQIQLQNQLTQLIQLTQIQTSSSSSPSSPSSEASSPSSKPSSPSSKPSSPFLFNSRTHPVSKYL
ncbi:hypothetical protein PCASD_00299 [Puccinia coronata f. sp. avenae]|uniref:Uncharacterized protein n=1 Tax=Puccinia coronata f. sp. avenae TaxID=200324 RepID=A0A2N5VNG5_9BASI|nr:hypothetical protein PCASD_00299 [Puccinia coronata f. sp. avenae]